MDLATWQFAKELHKAITEKTEKRKVHSPFIDNIWGADLADMQLLSNFNPIQDRLFRGCSLMGGWRAKRAALPKICHTYTTIMKLGMAQLYHT